MNLIGLVSNSECTINKAAIEIILLFLYGLRNEEVIIQLENIQVNSEQELQFIKFIFKQILKNTGYNLKVPNLLENEDYSDVIGNETKVHNEESLDAASVIDAEYEEINDKK